MSKCENCKLHIHSTPQKIWGSGDTENGIMIVNSAANDADEAAGQAVMDNTLKSRLRKLGIDPSLVYYTNAIKCRTPRGTKINVSEVTRCREYLLEEIEQLKPKKVLIIGSHALKALEPKEKITQICGAIKESRGYEYVATLSPGIVYHDPNKAPLVDRAFDNFGKIAKGKTIEAPTLNIVEITSMQQLRKFFTKYRSKYRHIAYDIETTGLERVVSEVNLLGFGNDKIQGIIPIQALYGPMRGKRLLQTKMVAYAVKEINKLRGHRIGQNGKFDDLFLDYHFDCKPILTFDTMLASHVLDENTPNGLKENAIKICNANDWDIDLDLKKGVIKSKQKYREYLQYLGFDIYYTYKLFKHFRKELRADPSIESIFTHISMKANQCYEDIQHYGCRVNQAQFKAVEEHLTAKLNDVVKKLNKYKKGINWGSPQQLQEFLFNELKLPVKETSKTTGKPSTGESALLQIRDEHPVVPLLLEYRGIAIQISHFIKGWNERMFFGRLHPNFKIHGTVTGRTSSNNPNLQQVPRDPVIRSLICAKEGRAFVEIDLSQAELRIAGIMSGDENLRTLYLTGGDVHNNTYNMIADDNIEDEKDPVQKTEKRKKAKAVNFGFLYGMGWKKFQEYARDTYGVHVTEAEAKQIRIRFFKAYPRLVEWHERQRKIVQALHQVRSPIGRLRRLLDIMSVDKGKQAEAQRQAINSPVQGFGSDITLLGMIEIMGYADFSNRRYRLDKTKFNALGTVHDSILFEVDEDYLEEFAYKAKHIVQSPRALKKIFNFESPIPIVADVAIGKSWGMCEELDFGKDWKAQILDIRKKIS